MHYPDRPPRITPDMLLQAYELGIFPMANDRTEREIFWVDPEKRGILPLDSFHISRSLRKIVKSGRFAVRYDSDFRGVMEGCREARPQRPESWINDDIMALYCALFARRHAHSIECRHDGQLVGGLYGVSIGAAFFGESMFSLIPNASKVALVYLVARLKAGGYQLLDTQFLTDHLARFGGIELLRGQYHSRLQQALTAPANFHALPNDTPPDDILELAGKKS